MSKHAVVAIVVCVLAGNLLAAQSAAPPPPPAEKIAGKWAMQVDIDNANASSILEMKIEGKKVTGTISSASVFPVAGEYVDGKLMFSIQYNAEMTVHFTGGLKEDGTLAGTMEYGQGAVNWRAKRP